MIMTFPPAANFLSPSDPSAILDWTPGRSVVVMIQYAVVLDCRDVKEPVVESNVKWKEIRISKSTMDEK